MSVVNEREVRVEFTSEWLGHNPGSQKTLWEHVANELIERGVAKEIVVKKVVEAPVKSMDSPPVDKMVDKPKAKKAFTRIR
jgi:hypothetical protein